MRGNVENETNEEKGGYGINWHKLYGTEMKNIMVPMIGRIGRLNYGKASVIKQNNSRIIISWYLYSKLVPRFILFSASCFI